MYLLPPPLLLGSQAWITPFSFGARSQSFMHALQGLQAEASPGPQKEPYNLQTQLSLS